MISKHIPIRSAALIFALLMIFVGQAAAAPVDPNAPPVEGTFGGLLFYITVAIAISFLCSVLEAVLLSASPSYIEGKASEGSRAARLMQKHKGNVELPIAAILTLNTFAHTIGAAGAGAEATAVFGSEFFGLISAVLTLMILIFSEIIPKTIGATYWKQLLSFGAYTIQMLVWGLFPVVWALQKMTSAIRPEEHGPTITRTEIEAMAKIGAGEGSLDESESRMLRNLFALQHVHVSDIMTPRTVMFALQQDMTVADVLVSHRLLPYSRIPIYAENKDDIVGFVLRHDILTRAAKDEDATHLLAFMRTLHAVPEMITIAKVLDEFVERQQHIFLVFDEYGGTAGLITMEDAIESLIGSEITDESDIAADMRKVAQERYQRQMGLLNSVIKDEPLTPNRTLTDTPNGTQTGTANGTATSTPTGTPSGTPPRITALQNNIKKE